MKKHQIFFKKVILIISSLFFLTVAMAQERQISGRVIDSNDGSGVPFAAILVKGTTQGTTTDIDGNYSIEVTPGATLVFSFVGYQTQEIVVANQPAINVSLVPGEELQEVIVIGYGQVKKEDATGSVAALDADEINKAGIPSPDALLTGKTAGVQVTSSGGAPGAGNTIRIRSGASLSASNNPLIVVDGVPLDDEDIGGMRNPLNAINPNDIETFSVLKDASATAIYGSRASNGVIIITTKKGKAGRPIKVTYNSTVQAQKKIKNIEVMTGDQFRNFVNTDGVANYSAMDPSLLGNENTNWQDLIFRTAWGHDHHLGFTGSFGKIPFRASLGYTNQEGILLSSKLQRGTASLRLTPSFLDNHLKVDISAKGMKISNQFSEEGVVGNAFSFDPTQPVYNRSNIFGGFFTFYNENTDGTYTPKGTWNPLAHLLLRDDRSQADRLIGNLKFDYKFHFLPELKLISTLGLDVTNSDGKIYIPEFAQMEYQSGGRNEDYNNLVRNQLFNAYLNYNKDIEHSNNFLNNSQIDVMAGYEWQHFYFSGNNDIKRIVDKGEPNEYTDYLNENFLISFFGRLNYSVFDKYFLTATFRRDGSSKLGQKWGNFPAIGFAWKLKNEDFLENVDVLSDLKLRLGWGITGQQDIGGSYDYLSRYTYSGDFAQYQLGDNFYTTSRAEEYDPNLKWEETSTINVGLDFGFLNNRFTGSLDFYKKDTKDLLNRISTPALSNLSNFITTNVGDMENIGFEFGVNGVVFQDDLLNVEVGYNITWQKSEITKLTAVNDPNYLGNPLGGIEGAVGNNIQINSVGHEPRSFYVYEQAYDGNGNAIEGVYVDRNGDGEVNESDLYHYKSPLPDIFMGLTSKITYDKFDFSFAARSNIGNYVYNNVRSRASAIYDAFQDNNLIFNNLTTSYFDTKFISPENAYFSDHYVRNASFVRMDNITLGYTFDELYDIVSSLRIYASVNNVFVVSDYEGIDPEIEDGIDDNIYPRPRTFLFGINVAF